MISFLLPIIYISFISLGLPDSILGAAWPTMSIAINAPLEACGMINMIISGSTIVSSLLSARLTKKMGAGLVTAISVGLTAASLAGFSFAPNLLCLCLLAVPYGLGAGAVDSALNNFVALHFKARHMSWLHCFWGAGASMGPCIMAFFLTREQSYHVGYRAISIIQIVLTILLFISLPLWKQKTENSNLDESSQPKSLVSVLKIKGVPFVLFAFFGYCALETTTGLWAASYLVNNRQIQPEIAARFASFFYLGITGGRFLNGFIAEKFNDRNLIRASISIAILGILMVMIPFSSNGVALTGLIIIGLGCAPIYPSIIHSTPDNFGRENSQSVVGIQMASAYLGSTFMPPLFGLIASRLGIYLYPFFLISFAIIILAGTEILNALKKHR